MVDDKPKLGGRNSDDALGSGHPKIGGDDQLGSSAERRAINRRNHGHRQCSEPQKNGRQIHRKLTRLHTIQIGTSAERRRRTGDNDNPVQAWNRMSDLLLHIE